jgi:nucleoside 2-deoxyribosyltransferase
MRFDDTPVMRAIRAGVQAATARHGRDLVRADDHDYTGELWANVALCLEHSDLVIAVLDQVEKIDCDANVMVELGFALAAGRRCLILVERRLRELPAVLRHRLTYDFDALDLPSSIERRVDDWLARNNDMDA